MKNKLFHYCDFFYLKIVKTFSSRKLQVEKVSMKSL